ncbi:Uncharacterised protein [Mycobacteroides abscessus subsp. abscessus]|nr:Uncharacterised protein [Mycobacteroides abscessus subsp. abscessus]
MQVRFRSQVDLVVHAAGAFGPQPDLSRGLLTADVQGSPAGGGPLMDDLQQQG